MVDFKCKEIDQKDLKAKVKINKNYIYGIIIINTDYIFLNGFRDNDDLYYIDIVSSNKVLSDYSLI